MVIPRENRIVRLYIQLNEIGKAGTQFNRTKITPDIIFKAAQKIMSPYQLAYKHCEWWTAYQVRSYTVGPQKLLTNSIDWSTNEQSIQR